jgi:hypothetical protein
VTRALFASLALALALAPSVAAHGDGAARGFTSTITSVTPEVEGVTVRVLDSDDRLRLRNDSGREIVIEGYDGEPYLRFSEDGVFRNELSPATYLNDERYGEVDVPAEADPEAEPRWERVSRTKAYEWHDHRAHWMSTIDPKKVRDAPDEEHRIFEWEIPGTIAGEIAGVPFTIAGVLDYAPPPDDAPPLALLVLPLVAAAAVGVAAWRLRGRRAA